MGIMGQQQGRDEAQKFIVTSMKMEINLRPLFWVYDRFFKMSAGAGGGER